MNQFKRVLLLFVFICSIFVTSCYPIEEEVITVIPDYFEDNVRRYDEDHPLELLWDDSFLAHLSGREIRGFRERGLYFSRAEETDDGYLVTVWVREEGTDIKWFEDHFLKGIPNCKMEVVVDPNVSKSVEEDGFGQWTEKEWDLLELAKTYFQDQPGHLKLTRTGKVCMLLEDTWMVIDSLSDLTNVYPATEKVQEELRNVFQRDTFMLSARNGALSEDVVRWESSRELRKAEESGKMTEDEVIYEEYQSLPPKTDTFSWQVKVRNLTDQKIGVQDDFELQYYDESDGIWYVVPWKTEEEVAGIVATQGEHAHWLEPGESMDRMIDLYRYADLKEGHYYRIVQRYWLDDGKPHDDYLISLSEEWRETSYEFMFMNF
ncbi:MAG: hypothetical protein IJ744_08330 [Lachnospiraceae bacterium]|nr:hypothetical protein [Lachnospiraceae bacterium]